MTVSAPRGERVHLVDCTLREGEQTPGVWLSAGEKLAILDRLAQAGVELADVCVPAVSEEELRFLARAARRSAGPAVGASLRLRLDEVELTSSSGCRHAFLIAPASRGHREHRLGLDLAQLLSRVTEVVGACVSRCIEPQLVAEDASRAEPAELARLLETGRTAGARRFFLCDTVGVWTPRRAAARVAEALSVLGDDAQLGVHCHNDFGMATANTIAAIEAGARWPTVTVNGIGERAGHASLAEVAVACSELLGLDPGIDLHQLLPLSEAIERATGIPLAVQSPLIGPTAFRHESGMHVHGVLQSPATYEPIDPERLGQSRTIVVGKHTGSALLRTIAGDEGLTVDDAIVEAALAAIKAERPAQRRRAFDEYSSARGRYLAQALGLPVEAARQALLDAGATSDEPLASSVRRSRG